MPSRDIKDCTETLQNVWKDLQEWYKIQYPNRELFLTCTYRSVEEQKELFARGRTTSGIKVTNCDGVTNPSKHNQLPSKAFDIGIKDNSLVTWADKYFLPIGQALEISKYKDNIRWGGHFKSIQDLPHIEEI